MTTSLVRPNQPFPGRETLRRLPASALSPAAARSIVRTACAEFPADTRDTAELLVSELVTNAVRDTTTSLLLTIDTGDGGVSIAVTDSSPATPQPHDPTDEDEHGRGLLLIGALATAWGWDRVNDGKRVWFEL